MEYIGPSTHPKEALANATRLIQLVYSLPATDRPEWVVRAREESAKLRYYYSEGAQRLSTASSDEQRQHINQLRNELHSAEMRLTQQIIAFTPVIAIPSKIIKSSDASEITPISHSSTAYEIGRVVGKTTNLISQLWGFAICAIFLCGIIYGTGSLITGRSNSPSATRSNQVPVVVATSRSCSTEDLTFLQVIDPIDKALIIDIEILAQMVQARNAATSFEETLQMAKRLGTFKNHVAQARSITPPPRFAKEHYDLLDSFSHYAAAIDHLLSLASTGDYANLSEIYYNADAMNAALDRTKQSHAVCLTGTSG